MASTTANKPIVIDNGSDTCKAGFAGDNEPKRVLPCVVGQEGEQGLTVGSALTKRYIGQEALVKESALTLKCPIERGVVTDWESMEAVWNHIFKEELSVVPSDHAVLMTETSKSPESNREKMAELMFETFKVPSFFVSCQAVLSLYSSGRTTGAVLDIGSGVTTVVPVYEGYSISEAVTKVDFAGRDLTELLVSLLSEKGLTFETQTDKRIVRTIKEKLCYVAPDYDKELLKASSTASPSPIKASYELPDGRSVSLETERFHCTESLFQPNLFGRANDPGLTKMISNTIGACEMDTRKNLFKNIILCGGSSLFDGMADRLRNELKALGKGAAEAKISAPKDRLLSAWIGGSVLSSVSSFDDMWIGRKDYEEEGLKIVHKKCF